MSNHNLRKDGVYQRAVKHGRRLSLRRLSAYVAASVAALALAGAVAAQNRGGSQLEVRLTRTGYICDHCGYADDDDDGTCPGLYRNGTDVVEGVVREDMDHWDAVEGEVVYLGVLKRRTHLGYCDSKEKTKGVEGEYKECVFLLSGTENVEVEIRVTTLGADVTMIPVPGSISVDVTGGCDAVTQSFARALYFKQESWNFATVPPGRLGVGRYGQDDNRGVKGVLEVVREVKDLEAVLQAGSAVRGQKAKLDASQSRGQIKTYSWTLTPLGNSRAPITQFVTTTPTVELVLLEDVKVYLLVTDSKGRQADTESIAKVIAREKWDTRYEEAAEGTLEAQGLVSPDEVPGAINHFGQNTCAYEGEDAAHGIHFSNPLTWRDDPEGYTLAMVTDPGRPFDGYWYVATEALIAKRQVLLNADLLKDSPLYAINRQHNTYSAFLKLVASCRDHEKMHGTLIKKALHAENPSKKIEALVDSSDEALATAANMTIRATETNIQEGKFHEQEVRSALAAKYREGGLVWVHDGRGGFASWAIDSFADKGD